MAASGRLLAQALVPDAHGSVADWLRVRDERSKLETALGISKSAWDSFKERVAITAPLVASSASMLLPGK